MARPVHRLTANTPGSFFVDASRIGYGTCWRWDPTHFAPGGGQARVARQPAGAGATCWIDFAPGQWREALEATLARCRNAPD